MSVDSISKALKGFSFERISQPLLEKKTNISESTQAGFSEALEKALERVNSLDVQAENLVAQATSGKKQVAPHELILSLEKADVAFELMNKVRQQVIRAYEEVMRTPI
jgi:flagellar hook-basal body complex protein FliE